MLERPDIDTSHIVLIDTLPGDETLRTLRSLIDEKGATCIALTDASARAANEAGLETTSFLAFISKEDWQNIDCNVRQWYFRIPSTPLDGGKTLKEIFWLGDVSYWWLMEQFLAFPGGLFDLVKYVHSVRSILDKARPSHLSTYVRDPSFARIIEHFAAGRHIKLTKLQIPPMQAGAGLASRLKAIVRTFVYRAAYFHPGPRLLAWWIALKRLLRGYRPAEGQVLILSFAPYSLRVVHDPESGTDRVADTYWDATEQEIAKHYPEKRILHIAIRIDRAQDKSLAGRLRTYRQLFRLAPDYVPLDYYMSLAESLRINRDCKELHSRWTHLVGSGAIRKLFSHEGIDFSSEFNAYLTPLMPSILGLAVRQVRLMDRAIRAERPGVAALNGESQCVGRALIAACQRHGVPTAGLQHGCLSLLFSSDDLTYCHDAIEDIRHEAHDHPSGCPIPTRTFVWGEYWKRGMVEKHRFPTESIALTGNPRYDTLIKADKYDRDAIRRRHSLAPGTFTILYATSSATYRSDFQPVDCNAIHMRAVLDCFEGLENAQLIIKFHPVDDMSVYDAPLQARWNNPNIRLADKDDVLSLISVSDLLISRYSGTMIEAAAFGVPSINLNLIDVPDNIDFVGQGGALGVSREQDLRPAVVQFMEGGGGAQALAERRPAFLRDWIHGNDGLSANRAMRVMMELSGQGISTDR